MNQARYIHTVTGERATVTATAGKRDRTWVATNSGSSMRVLIEGLPSRERAELIGHIPQARYRMTWPSGTDILEGDRITYSGQVFFIAEITDDTLRLTGGYQTGILTRKPIG